MPSSSSSSSSDYEAPANNGNDDNGARPSSGPKLNPGDIYHSWFAELGLPPIRPYEGVHGLDYFNKFIARQPPPPAPNYPLSDPALQPRCASVPAVALRSNLRAQRRQHEQEQSLATAVRLSRERAVATVERAEKVADRKKKEQEKAHQDEKSKANEEERKAKEREDRKRKREFSVAAPAAASEADSQDSSTGTEEQPSKKARRSNKRSQAASVGVSVHVSPSPAPPPLNRQNPYLNRPVSEPRRTTLRGPRRQIRDDSPVESQQQQSVQLLAIARDNASEEVVNSHRPRGIVRLKVQTSEAAKVDIKIDTKPLTTEERKQLRRKRNEEIKQSLKRQVLKKGPSKKKEDFLLLNADGDKANSSESEGEGHDQEE
ncbi:hypothetical protein LTR05_008389 [Lithohypha guttulata]|uniref:Uncharacterized protein n=1 Tax=Lithohypha guttulata TaxID=1690604 RepID=A0AAN7SER3_9EURO|nr:hypothetical protein LTR05_008389 [Lithohypha guttulata]